jgi:hypothetical protein
VVVFLLYTSITVQMSILIINKKEKTRAERLHIIREGHDGVKRI